MTSHNQSEHMTLSKVIKSSFVLFSIQKSMQDCQTCVSVIHIHSIMYQDANAVTSEDQ